MIEVLYSILIRGSIHGCHGVSGRTSYGVTVPLPVLLMTSFLKPMGYSIKFGLIELVLSYMNDRMECRFM